LRSRWRKCWSQLLPHADKIRFANTGTEAAMAALRLCRALTGRRKIIKFEGHYHGWSDPVILNTNAVPPTMMGPKSSPIRIVDSAGVLEEAWLDTVVVPWNDVEMLERAMEIHGHDAACVVTEGIMANMGVILPKPGYLKRIEQLCRLYGAMFYLDETVTGFRVAPGGCAELYDLKPDIVTYGKALGAGLPMAAIAGPDHVMSGLEWGKVLHYGTHNAGRLSLAVTKTMLEVMLADDRANYTKLAHLGTAMAEAIRNVSKGHNRHRAIVQGVNSMFQIFTDADEIADYRDYSNSCAAPFRDFAVRLFDKGIYMPLAVAVSAVLDRPHRRHRPNRQGGGRSAGRDAVTIWFIGTGHLAAFFVEGPERADRPMPSPCRRAMRIWRRTCRPASASPSRRTTRLSPMPAMSLW
jgi:glutamate-1-semialdehyde 2,1-aminomutase